MKIIIATLFLLLSHFLTVAQNLPTVYKVTYKPEVVGFNKTNEKQIKKDSTLTELIPRN